MSNVICAQAFDHIDPPPSQFLDSFFAKVYAISIRGGMQGQKGSEPRPALQKRSLRLTGGQHKRFSQEVMDHIKDARDRCYKIREFPRC